MSLVERAIKRLAEARAGGNQGKTANGAASIPPFGPLRHANANGQTRTPDADSMPHVRARSRRAIDFTALRASGMLAADHERKAFNQVFRGIKRPILARAAQRDVNSGQYSSANVLMVCSAVPGDGKTFMAINLALSMALEREKQVVLVDGDVVKRELSRRLGFGNDGGLIELLEDSSRKLDEYLVETDVPSLLVLPAGRTSTQATELLSSARMRELVEHCAGNSDSLVVFDSPPLLLTTESRAIAEMAGQAILVVREGYTSKDMLARALPLLQGCPSVSLVLNQSLSSPNSGYGYDYGESISTQKN